MSSFTLGSPRTFSSLGGQAAFPLAPLRSRARCWHSRHADILTLSLVTVWSTNGLGFSNGPMFNLAATSDCWSGWLFPRESGMRGKTGSGDWENGDPGYDPCRETVFFSVGLLQAKGRGGDGGGSSRRGVDSSGRSRGDEIWKRDPMGMILAGSSDTPRKLDGNLVGVSRISSRTRDLSGKVVGSSLNAFGLDTGLPPSE
mmetsp:Transcript_15103/g.35579  ORF Transcript_15103/g.35579 Transcript_15103/m.35579 type:complete len:200 (+) Transcript_15103:579-1178(+)